MSNNKKSRILLIRPYFKILEHELVFLPFEPLGLQYIQSYLADQGYQTKLYDCLVERPRKIKYLKDRDIFRCGSSDEDVLRIINKFKPDIVCISGMFYSQSSTFYALAKIVKSVSSEIVVIGGGAFPSSYRANTLRDCPEVDLLVVGEGEKVILDLIENLEYPERVKGVCFRDKKTKEIFCNEPPPVNMDLDSIHFPYRDFSKIYNYCKSVGYNFSPDFNLKKIIKSSLFYFCLSVPLLRMFFAKFFNFRHRKNPNALFMPYGFIVTSRGCPNCCTFCAIHKVWGSVYRMRSAENVLAEIDLLVRHGVKEIIIVDDNFTVSKKRTIEICDGIVKKGYKIRLLTPSGVFISSLDKEVLEHLYAAGLRELQFGVENGDQEFLDNVIRKNLKLEQVKKIVVCANEIGFRTRGFFIFGYPGETRQTMLKTFRFAFESGMHSARFYVFQPLPGTEAYHMAQEMGALDKNLDFSKLKMRPDSPVVETKDFSKNDVMKIFDLAYETLEKRNYEEIKDRLPDILGLES